MTIQQVEESVKPLSVQGVIGLTTIVSTQTGIAGLFASYALWRSKLKLLLLAYFNWVVWDDRAFVVNQQPRKPPSWLNWLPKWLGEYFDLSIVKTSEIDPHQGPYMFCMHPHGLFGFGPQAVAPRIDSEVSPGLNIRHAGIKGVFYMPFFREFAIAFNAIPVEEQLMLAHLKEGISLTVVVGGASEALLCGYPDVLPLVLDKRKGFIRLAVRSGARLVPCLNFGESQTFTQVFNQKLRNVQNSMMDVFGYSIPLIAPFFPKRQKLTMVIGAALDPIKIDCDGVEFDRAVDELHTKYIQAIKSLHEEHRKQYGLPSEQKLVIVSSDEARDLNSLKSKL